MSPGEIIIIVYYSKCHEGFLTAMLLGAVGRIEVKCPLFLELG